MARGPLTFRQRDMERAVRAMRRAGVRRYRMEAEGGKVVVYVDDDAAKVSTPEPLAEVDEWEGAEAL